MTNITNTKIQKVKRDIEKTKGKIAELQTKQQEQEELLRHYDDLEIVAQFRSKYVGDEDLASVLPRRGRPKKGSLTNGITSENAAIQKEEKSNDEK
jgi:hypothetical protein